MIVLLVFNSIGLTDIVLKNSEKILFSLKTFNSYLISPVIFYVKITFKVKYELTVLE